MARAKLQGKLVRTMVLMPTVVAAILIALLVSVSVRLSQRNLAAIDAHQRESLSTKSRMLAENHALALKSLVLDNALGDVARLIERAVIDDRGLVFGLFPSAEGGVWAFAGPGASPDMPAPKAYAQIGLSSGHL